MGFTDAIKTGLAKYADFSGRAVRSEYWYFILFGILLQFVLVIALGLIVGGASSLPDVAAGLVGLALLVPSVAVAARRLHDIDKSGWWQLIILVPIIGIFVLLYFMCQRGSEGANRFGA